MTQPTCQEIDTLVGKRVRYLRTVKGMSQEALGDQVGVTFQQIQKYERGINRISASKLYQLSLIFGVSVASFFEGVTDTNAAPASSDTAAEPKSSPPPSRKHLELMRAFDAIPGDDQRRALLKLAQTMGGR